MEYRTFFEYLCTLHTGYKLITHGFMFAYLKEYPHPRGVCCKTSWIAILRVLPLTKKNLRTFIFLVRQKVQKWVRVKRGKHRTSTRLAPMLQNTGYQVLLRLLKYTCITMGAIHSTNIQTGPTGKRGPPQKVDLFFRNFSGWTEPIHWVLDRNFRKFWLNGSRPM